MEVVREARLSPAAQGLSSSKSRDKLQGFARIEGYQTDLYLYIAC